MRKYSKAYYLKDLRSYDGWKELERSDGDELSDETIVYLQDNYTVVKDVFDEEDYIFSDVDDTWMSFCKEKLEFEIPDFGSAGATSEAAN
ncbi:MAG: hypothetical protein KDD47_07940 [Acidobacteria bacterium]|nr:hypothetical protein [Acidobacteriota bacterium]